jgi:hypothetical protein
LWLYLGKITIKETTQICGHSLKLHFCMFGKSQGKFIIIWIVIILLKYFPLITKFTCSKFDTNQKCFCRFKTFKLQEWTILIFFKHHFFLPNVHHSFWKLERILLLMIRRAKGFELMIFFLITHLSKFGSKVLLTLKIMDFENVV